METYLIFNILVVVLILAAFLARKSIMYLIFLAGALFASVLGITFRHIL